MSNFFFIGIMNLVIALKYQLKLANQTIEIEVCRTFWKRLLGFMFQRKKITMGKCFPHCNSIHTFFMFQKIDIILCDSNMKVIAMKRNFPTNRILWPIKNAWYVLELPLESIQNIQIGDQLNLKDF